MKNSQRIITTLIILVVITQTSQAAVRFVRQGDTPAELSRLTGFSEEALAAMNETQNLEDIVVLSQPITFLSVGDMADARSWCEKRMRELWPSDPNHQHFSYTLEDIEKRHFRFSIYEYSGTHYSSILVYAKAWRQSQTPMRIVWTSMLTGVKGHGECISNEVALSTLQLVKQKWADVIEHRLERCLVN